MTKIPLLNIAYVHDADADEHCVFKVTTKGDYELYTCKTANEAQDWINNRFKLVASNNGNSFYTFNIDQTKPF
jgi:hypothetical protein